MPACAGVKDASRTSSTVICQFPFDVTSIAMSAFVSTIVVLVLVDRLLAFIFRNPPKQIHFMPYPPMDEPYLCPSPS